jgi:pyridoxine/pyridoxamine 5'-phosphate oxidase
MKASTVLAFMRLHRLAVQAAVSEAGAPQAAVVGVAVSDRLEIIFDTLGTTRKAQNLRRDPRIAFVIGGWVAGDERTVQYEGVVDEPSGRELERLKAVYYAADPDGPARARWPGMTCFRARPTWIRYSDFSQDPPAIVELRPEA